MSVDASISSLRFGVRGEFLVGDALGTYNAGIGQSLNPETLQAITTYAGWGDVWVKLTDCLTFHIGYGVDDPRNDDLGVVRQNPFDPTSMPIAGQRARNEVATHTASECSPDDAALGLALIDVHRRTLSD